MSVKRIISALAAAVMILCSVVSISAVEPEPAKLKIIDISMWSNQINWSLASGEIDGAIARIGYRGSENRTSLAEDPLFYSHMSGAKQYSVPFGVYFYSLALNKDEAVEEAEWVIDKLKEYSCKPDMPIYIDIEDTTVQKNLTNRERTDVALAFCKTMADNGYYAGVYANKYWLSTLVYAQELEKYPIWVAEYFNTCTYTGEYGMWQYSDSGDISGITGSVDMNECYCDYPSFIKKSGYNGYGSGGTVTEDKDYSKQGTYKTSAVFNVRSGPSDSGSLLGTLPSGSEIYIEYATNGWGAISYSNRTGWIKLGSSVSKSSKYISTQQSVGYYTVNTDVLNVRSGAGTENAKVSELRYSDTVFINGTQNGWGWFYGGNSKQWISLDYAVFYGTVSFETGISGKYIEPLKIKTGGSAKLPKWNFAEPFGGWAVSSGGAVKYSDEATVSMDKSNVVLYAVGKSSSDTGFSFIKKPRQSENGTAVISEEGLSEAEFIKTYISLGGCSYTAKPSAASVIGTGSEITFTQNGKPAGSLTVIVSGDCNGDGACDGIDLADALNISQGSKSTVSYSASQKKAADVNLDGKVDSTDINLIKKAAFGSADLPE